MENWKTALILLATCLGMISIVPLMVWGGSGDWRRALQALGSYLGIIGGLAVVGGGFGLVMAIAEHGFGPVLSIFGL